MHDLVKYASFTDEELLRILYVKDDISELELELGHRLENALERIAELEMELDEAIENGFDA